MFSMTVKEFFHFSNSRVSSRKFKFTDHYQNNMSCIVGLSIKNAIKVDGAFNTQIIIFYLTCQRFFVVLKVYFLRKSFFSVLFFNKNKKNFL